MKKYHLLFLLIFIGSCTKSDQNIELIDPSGGEYVSIGFKPRIHRNSQITPLYNLPDAQKLKMNNAIKVIKKKRELFDHVKRMTFNYKLFVNEFGKIDKLLVIGSMHKTIDTFLLKEMENWEMGIYEKDGKKQKYSILWTFELTKVKGDSLGVFHSSIPVGEQISLEDLSKTVDGEDYFVLVDEMPSPIGGIKSIQEKIDYPEIAKRAGIEGRVFVKAFINEKGNVKKTEIIKGIGGGCDQEAIKAVMETKFKPGRQKGKGVNVQVTIPILFKLESKTTNLNETDSRIEKEIRGLKIKQDRAKLLKERTK